MNKKKTYLENSIFYIMIGYIFTIIFEVKEITDTLLVLMIILSCTNIYYKKISIKDLLKDLPSWIKWALGSMVVSSIILIFFSPEMRESFKDVKVMIKQIIPFLVIFYFVKDKNKIKILFCTFLVTIFFEIGYALLSNINEIYNVLYNNIYYRLEGYRLDGYRTNFMEFSMKLQYFLVSIYILLLNLKNKKVKSILACVLFIGLIALFFNNTRMAWIVVGIMFIIISCLKIKNVKILFALFGTVMILFTGIVYSQQSVQERIKDTIYMRDSSSQLHYMFVKDSLVMIKEKPIVGWGIGQFSREYNENFRSEETNYLIKKYNDPTPVPHPHNNIIMIGVEKGFIGIFSYIFCFGCFLLYSFKDWYKYKGISSLIFFLITMCIVLHGFSEYSLGFRAVMQFFYCLLGMYLVYREYEIEDKGVK